MRLIYVPFLLLLAIGYCTSLSAQATNNHLTVLGEASEEVMADQATLNINLSFSDEKDITMVYEQHKAARERILAMLTELKVPAKDIQTQLLLVRKERDFSMGNPPSDKFKGFQRVLIKFGDLKRYADIQQHIASNGFTDVATTFSLSNQRDIELRLFEQAVVNAQRKADRLAKAVSRSIKGIVRLGDTDENEVISTLRATTMLSYMNSYQTDRPINAVQQTFRLNAVVKVVYELN
ncbi:hypothetical protein GCM10028806_30320 [Spirosoma terrae]|uniref:SIMPL domain-containing protein n=1 Tax=Spirosoma terrae TaxID=1968276 RepID=A0A6L9L484_9BACT|nr:SIMPL domain-containing protein [Spirosoma terrae]NDU95346.1 SIMPL domain-containing protein [Spirosoma terrae]